MYEMTTGLEIERKYIILKPDVELLRMQSGFSESRILQTYLTSDSGVTHRVRSREREGSVTYTECTKVRVDAMSSVESQRELTKEEYEQLLTRQDPATVTVVKTRYTVDYGGIVLEIDVYPGWSRTCIMEIELPSHETVAEIPDYIRVVCEVTGDRRYSNASMSVCFPEEISVD